MKVGNDDDSVILAGTFFGNQPRLVRIRDHSIDVNPEGCLLIFENTDAPGVVGALGQILGKHGINIANMSLSRTQVGGKALSVLNVDTEIGEEVDRGNPRCRRDPERALRGSVGLQGLNLNPRRYLSSRSLIAGDDFVFNPLENEPAPVALCFDSQTGAAPLDFFVSASGDFEGKAASVPGKVRIEKGDCSFQRTDDAEGRGDSFSRIGISAARSRRSFASLLHQLE